MDYDSLRVNMFQLNTEERFYRSYYCARQQEDTLKKFLEEMDMDEVREKRRLIYEIPDTFPTPPPCH